MEIINIKDIKQQKLGGKALGLKKLLRYNVPVPDAFVIDSEFIEALISNDSQAIQRLQSFVSSFKLPDKLAIRSSANNEDGNKNSFAGMYESVLNVSIDLNEIINAIKKVYGSLDSKRINSYSNQKTYMNIVIQKMINPKIAGVCFTKAIDINGEDVVLIEYVDGLGEKLVSGKAIAKTIIANLDNMTYINSDNIEKEVIDELLKYLKIIKSIADEDLDIEWCVDENNNAFFVQARPITKPILIRPKTNNGAIASPGSCKGSIYIIDEDAEDEEIERKIEEFPEGAILLAKTTDTNYVPAMKKASGIITTEGSILSHAAIIARELNIPCITGFKKAFNLFKEKNEIEFNTNNRKMIYNGKIIPFGDGKQINELELYLFDNIIEENINGNLVLVEKLNSEFGMHIEDELEQEEIDVIEIYIRKKYKQAPVILKDQKYLWYFEYKRFMNIPGFNNLVSECNQSIDSFDIKQVESFISKVCSIMGTVYEESNSEYEKLFASEYAQATHFIINLHMCNGLAMKKLIYLSEKLGFNSLEELMNSNNKKVNEFFEKIETIREKIWGYYVKNNWSNDDYFDTREENMQLILQNDSEEIIDYFYNNLQISDKLESVICGYETTKKKL